MPIVIPKKLPANHILASENIFVMNRHRAKKQDIRPLRILLLNLMPTKIATETQFARLIGNTPIQVELVLLKTASYEAKNTEKGHLEEFYQTFDQIRRQTFDGMIITGAPVEQMDFEQVVYWPELKRILDFAQKNVQAIVSICWGAQAALYHFYGIPKHALEEKCFGIFPHRLNFPGLPLFRGFDSTFNVPHSRHTEVRAEEIKKHPRLILAAVSQSAGAGIVMSRDSRQLFVFGHLEYDEQTLASEYERDLNKGLRINPPVNYFVDNDPQKPVNVTWRSHAHLLFANWINYCVYQETPYDLTKLKSLVKNQPND